MPSGSVFGSGFCVGGSVAFVEGGLELLFGGGGGRSLIGARGVVFVAFVDMMCWVRIEKVEKI